MENFSYHVPTYLVTGGVATSGHSSTIGAGEVGLVDRQTWSVATLSGNGKEFFFAQGATGGFDWNGKAITDSHKSPYFYAKDVVNMYKSLPQRLVNEEWVIGYDGSQSSRGFNFTKGATTRLKFIFSGDPIYRKFGGPKEYQVSYTVPVDCVNPDCVDNCDEEALDCRPHTIKLIDMINNHIELQQFGVSAKLVTDTYVAGTPDHTKWCLSLCDTGDVKALQAVQNQMAEGLVATRIARVGAISTYQTCRLTTEGTPASFIQTGAIALAVCEECPDGSTLQASSDVYYSSRPLGGTEDLTDDAAKDTYADGVGGEYGVATDADVTFVGQNGAVAIIKVKFPVDTVVEALLADTVEFSHTEPALCVWADPAVIQWTDCGSGISSSRTLKTKLARPECDADGDRMDELTALVALYPTLSDLTLIAGDGCVDEYTVVQRSNDCLEEGCLTENVTFTYDTIPSLDDAIWEVVEDEGVANLTRSCGIRITAGYIDPSFGDCSFDPKDYYNDEPVRFELAVFDESAGACDYDTLPTVFRSRVGKIQRQTGEWVIREVLQKNEAYLRHVKQWDMDSRTREAFDLNTFALIDRKAFYTLYYVSFGDSYHKMDRKNENEKFTAVFAFKENDQAGIAFENGPLAILAGKSGVALHVNE